ncbi:hypothetical protein GOP47_0026005 [Adiantum capillus-veneris]|uniref:Pentatricopeptide repeat-containing protein n=1 Tax=Adiantum capillus-veneris TaxID=13818 RepID=A0A9D4U3V7_ADICA|nr:hypothetical protein GOP47_0026005 [Adiantum capillus-veneris]
MLTKILLHCSPVFGQQWRLRVKCDKGGSRALHAIAPVACTSSHQAAATKGENASQETQDSCTCISYAGVNKAFSDCRKLHPDFKDIQHLLQYCKKKGDQVLAWQVNIYLCEFGLETHRLLGNYLVSVLSEIGSIHLALNIFNRLAHRDDCSWNSLVTGNVLSGNPKKAVALYQELEKDSTINLSGYTFVALLKACTKLKDVDRGFEVHTAVARAGFLEKDVFVGSALVDMYAKCGLLTRAQEVFDYLPIRDVVSWNALINGYINHDRGKEALNVFEQMQQYGFSPTDVTYLSSLKACSCIRALEKGQQLHSKIEKLWLLKENKVVGNILVDMYAKCGLLSKAQEVFDELLVRDVVTWNTLINGYVEHGHDKEAIRCFNLMQRDVVFPDAVTFVCSLKACGNLKALDKGQEFHAEIDRKGLLETDLVVGNALVDMYARCGFLYQAHQLVNSLPIKSTIAWNALITGYVDQGYNKEGLECFKEMQLNNGVLPDAATFICTLKACGSMRMQDKVLEIHAEAARKGAFESDLLVGSTLVDAYAKCGSLCQAQEVFERLPQRGVVAWTALISGYCEYGHINEALKGLKQMQREGFIPDAVTYVCILKACGTTRDLEKGLEIHAEIDKLGLLSMNLLVASTLVDMYAKCGMLGKARIVFDKLPLRDVVTWNALIVGYTLHGQGEEAILLFERMQAEGLYVSSVTVIYVLKACSSIGNIDKGEATHAEISRIEALNGDLSIGNTLVDMYAKFGLVAKAQEVFNNLPSRDTVSWNALLTGYVEHGYAEEALDCFEQMQQDGVLLNNITLACCLKACGCIAAIVQGQHIHVEAERSGLLERDLSIGTNLVDMYAKCGIFTKAWEVFDKISVRDVVSWTALIAGYTEHGFAEDALNCLERMLLFGIYPDAFTYVWSLKACASLGATDKGQEIHAEVERKGLLEKDLIVGNALLDMYVKCGLLTKAQEVFDQFLERDVISWNSLLSGHTHLGDCENAFYVFDRMLGEGFKPGSGTFTIVLSACSRMGLFDKGQSYFQVMCKDHGIIPTLEHGTCMVDLLCRGGHLNQAILLIEKLSLNKELAVWHALLTSCTNWGNIELGSRAFQHAVCLNRQHATSYCFMSKLFLDKVEPAKIN